MNTKGWIAFLALVIVSLIVAPVFAQGVAKDGKLKIHVNPKQAYVFVDGKAIRDGSQTIRLSAGHHEVGVYNYGYTPKTQDVNVTSDKATTLDVTLQADGNKVSGPFADIELKGHPRAAVLLNGTTPSYFVGHVDEFDNNFIWPQRLLVKPGTYQVTVTQKGQTIWSGPVSAKAGERVVVDLNHNGAMKTRDFKQGNTLGPQPRFHAGIASAEIPIAPVEAQLAASPTQTACGQSVQLNWKSTDAVDTSISNLGNVPGSGDRSVKPMRTTTYELVAKGPGGEAQESAKVDVNAQPTATISFTPAQIRYHKIGDKVVEQDSATLTWTTSNGSTVTIQPLGNVAPSGSRTIKANVDQNNVGAVDHDVTYTMHVTNACGGAVTKTATLHVAGSVEPPPPVTLASLFYPTNYPERNHPKVGLVASQEQTLAKAASSFKNSSQYDPQYKLEIIGHADVRGPAKYNQALSERRAERVKDYLVSQGISADRMEIQADGKKDELSQKEVEQLQSQDPQKPDKWESAREKATWLAYNRRVDVVLEPVGEQSAKIYPNAAPDARVLWQRPVPSLKTVESAANYAGETSNHTVATNR